MSPPHPLSPTPRRFVLLDRDGTLNVERHYLSREDDVELLPGVAEGLRRMQLLGLGLAVVTNQSGLARGYFDVPTLERIHARLAELLLAQRVRLDGLYYCPHRPEDGCDCRKPRPGLIERAARECGFDPAAAIVVGDKACDVELGKNVGATTILVRTGYGAETERRGESQPDFVVDDLSAAARVIQERILVDLATDVPEETVT